MKRIRKRYRHSVEMLNLEINHAVKQGILARISNRIMPPVEQAYQPTRATRHPPAEVAANRAPPFWRVGVLPVRVEEWFVLFGNQP